MLSFTRKRGRYARQQGPNRLTTADESVCLAAGYVVIHVLPGGETVVGEKATVGHGAILHNCQVGRGAVVGMNCVVLDEAVLGEEAMLAAGSVLREKTRLPDRHLAAGAPAAVKKELSGLALGWVQTSADSYADLVRRYLGA